MKSDEAQAKIRAAAQAGNVEFLSQDGVESFGEQFVADFLVGVLDCESAWISDQSALSDFGQRGEAAYERIENIYGVDVHGKNNLLDIFRAIHALNRTVQ